MKKALFFGSIAILLDACAAQVSQHAADPAIRIGGNDLGGVVTSANGPEAGVWVIAETTDLPTRYSKIVVTDDRGRYVIPDLPQASYTVWARGYGLLDSPKAKVSPGKLLDVRAPVALTPAAAAEYYPAAYWYSMLRIPEPSEFGGSGITKVKTQAEWLNIVKTNGCVTCHQMGNRATRTMPKDFAHMASTDAWMRRLASGQAMTNMMNAISRIDVAPALKHFAEWSDRIAAGAVPSAQPSRPQGVERNVVITLWDWSRATAYMHDEISTDRRKPTVNANGPLYGAPEESTDYIPILDPVRHVATEVKHPVRDPATPSSAQLPLSPSPYWGTTKIWDSQTSMHNPMLDEQARVWFTARVRPPENPAFCRAGSSHPSARVL